MSYGWLPYNPDAPDTIVGVSFDKVATRTRACEYDLVHRLAPPAGHALDAATGYVPNWHVLPYILAAMGWTVEAIDYDERHLHMPKCAGVARQLANIATLPYDDNTFDMTTCISVLEHCPEPVRTAFATEAARVTKPGGLIIITADNYPGVTPEALANLIKVGFDVGDRDSDSYSDFGGGKRVAYATGIRRASVPD